MLDLGLLLSLSLLFFVIAAFVNDVVKRLWDIIKLYFRVDDSN